MKCKPWKMVRGRKKSVDQSVGREVFALKSTKYDNAANALTKITNFSGRHCCYSHYRFTLYLFFFRSFSLAFLLSFSFFRSHSFCTVFARFAHSRRYTFLMDYVDQLPLALVHPKSLSISISLD